METPEGFVLETPTLSDLPAIYELINGWDLEVAGVSDFTLDDLRSLTSTPGFDPMEDWWLLRAGSEPAALGFIWPGETGVRHSTFSLVIPAFRGHGLGSYSMALTERRAETLATGASSGIVMHAHTDRADPGGAEIVTRAGYVYIRSAYTMMGELPLEGMDDTTMPDGITIRNATEQEGALMHTLVEEVFAGSFDHSPRTYEVWAASHLDRSDSSPDLWWIAEAGSEPAGILMGSLNKSTGWVGSLGVRDAFRGKGIGKALLRHSFRRFAEIGCTDVGLGVDASNETGAVQLYESVGLKAARIYDTFEKTYPAER
jgi:GNAT superfamily N-acetyltransferase